MLKFVFAGIVGVWALVGWLGALHANVNRVNYEMLIFLFFAPALPIIAALCGMF